MMKSKNKIILGVIGQLLSRGSCKAPLNLTSVYEYQLLSGGSTKAPLNLTSVYEYQCTRWLFGEAMRALAASKQL